MPMFVKEKPSGCSKNEWGQMRLSAGYASLSVPKARREQKVTERVAGRFFWSSQRLNKEYQKMLGTSRVRKNLEVCERCGITVDFLWRGLFPKESFQQDLATIKAYVAQQECGNHHLPPGEIKPGL